MLEQNCCENTSSLWGQLKKVVKRWKNEPRAYQIEKRLAAVAVNAGQRLGQRHQGAAEGQRAAQI